MRLQEAYVGEYASGKSENAINRALSLLGQGQPVTLVDLDLVEPFYTLRPLKEQLTGMGLNVLSWQTGETVGLGEVGLLLKPEMRWALKREGHIIMDVGYGVSGSKVFNLLEGYPETDLQIVAVINIARPMTGTVNDIIDYLKGYEEIDGLLNNSHLGQDTSLEIIREGVDVISEVSRILDIPVIATSVEERFREEIGTHDHRGNPVRYLKRFMQHAFW